MGQFIKYFLLNKQFRSQGFGVREIRNFTKKQKDSENTRDMTISDFSVLIDEKCSTHNLTKKNRDIVKMLRTFYATPIISKILSTNRND
ncbi:hypothetical protein MXB_2320 [Myxobolus squamalis]|nr:hypothetical protein MXB_2320 [Myxobolus squamalis]